MIILELCEEIHKLKYISELLELDANSLLNFENKNTKEEVFSDISRDIYASAGLGTSSQSEEAKIVSVDENFSKRNFRYTHKEEL